MTEIVELIGLGFFAGTYGAIIGAGGGFIIVPMLLFLFNFDIPRATGTSLIAVFCIGLSASIGYAWQRRIDYQTALKFAGGAIPGAITGSLIAQLIHFQAFSGLLGVLLTTIGVLTILRGPEDKIVPGISNRWTVARHLVDYYGRRFEYPINLKYGLMLCFGGGAMAALFGIGGGVIIVPALIFLQRIPHQIAVSTSAVILTISSLTGALSYSLQGTVDWFIALPLASGALLGAQAGSRIHRRLTRPWVIRLLSLALLVVGGRMLWAAFRGQ